MPWVASRARSLAIITRWRGRRSAHTPPASENSAKGTVLGRDHQPDVGRRPSDREDREGKRHEGHAVADDRERLAPEQQRVLRFVTGVRPGASGASARVLTITRSRTSASTSKFAWTSPTSSLSSSVSIRRISLPAVSSSISTRDFGSPHDLGALQFDARVFERCADRLEVSRLGEDLEHVLVHLDVFCARVDRDHQVVLGVAARRRRR